MEDIVYYVMRVFLNIVKISISSSLFKAVLCFTVHVSTTSSRHQLVAYSNSQSDWISVFTTCASDGVESTDLVNTAHVL